MTSRIQIVLIFFLSAVFIIPNVTYGAELPRNNKFGIHILQPTSEDVKKTAELVNGNGGKWGYVTLVIQENDRDRNKWQELFDNLREYKLIPIVRIATNPEPGAWRRPNREDVNGWVEFLNSLNWVVQKRYVILFNETNHAAEWGGAVDPEGYADIAVEFTQKLKEKNKDFFVMIAGFDASAPSSPPIYEDEAVYLKRVIGKIGAESFNDLFDGFSSHSYPNPAFAGSPNAHGKGTVRTYQWELEYLKEMGVKDLPVFITETGWDASRVSREQIAEYIQYAYENVWLPDDRVIAVTPFVLNYQEYPFINFSWSVKGNGEYHPQYYLVQQMNKVAGAPQFIEKGEINDDLPEEIVVQSTYHFKIKLKNNGQAIWDNDEGYHLAFEGAPKFTTMFSTIHKIRPGQEGIVDLLLETPGDPGTDTSRLLLKKGDKSILTGRKWTFKTLAAPSLQFRVSFYPKLRAMADDTEIQVFDEKENIVYKEKNVRVRGGMGRIEKVPNIVLRKKYRVVILRPYYLPRQTHVTFQKGENTIRFAVMFPLDFNKDGALNGKDLETLVQDLRLLGNWVPSVK